MLKRMVWLACAAAFLSAAGMAQSTAKLKRPLQINSVDELGAHVMFTRKNKMSSQMKATANREALALQSLILSVPHWSGRFRFQGTTYPYTMVGSNPRFGGTTSIGTDLIPISLLLDGYVDQNGNPIVLDVTPDILPVQASPDFAPAPYDSGFTEFGDAVQRAEFFSDEKPSWHTLLGVPRVLAPVTVEVPTDEICPQCPQGIGVFQLPNGTILAFIDAEFFISQLNTIVQLEPLHVGRLPIALTSNALLYENDDPNQCCVLGFHTAFDVSAAGSNAAVQTFAWANWLDPGIFLDPTVADVLPLSHEISEWLNDPFINNVVPPWQNPDGSGTCGGNFLETGDPVEVLNNIGFPVTLGGFTYHPQSEALLQWFERKVPSDAIDHAYSFPDTTLLTSPSQACTAPPPASGGAK